MMHKGQEVLPISVGGCHGHDHHHVPEEVELLGSIDEDNMMPWFPDALAKVMQFTDERNTTSIPVQAQSIITAVDILQCFQYQDFPIPHVGAIEGGGLGMDFKCDQRELEIEILPDGKGVEWLVNETTESGRLLPATMKSGKSALDNQDLGVYVLALGAWLLGADVMQDNPMDIPEKTGTSA